MIVIGGALANGEIPCSGQANALLGNGTNGSFILMGNCCY